MSACSRRVLPSLTKLLTLAALGALSLLATLPLSAQTESTAHSFTDGYDGGYPFAGLIQGWDGVLRGGTSQGGASLTSGGPSYGTYFSYDLYPGDPFAFTSVYSFCSDADGGSCSAPGSPLYSLVQGPDGKFYGTANGQVYQLSGATLSSIYVFPGTQTATPYASMIVGSDGLLYGTTYAGGDNDDGSIFKITTAGSLTTLHSFSTTTGYNPCGQLLQGADGNFYGTTYQGGANNVGTIFKLTASGTYSTLHAFDTTDGAQSCNGLVQGVDGNLYGSTSGGGATYTNCLTTGCGTIFKITPTGTFTLLHSLNGSTDGANPAGTLAVGSDGNFYGATVWGGDYSQCGVGCGILFEVTPTGTYTNLHSFAALSDGAGPNEGPIQANDGNLYGTTQFGGNGGCLQSFVESGCGAIYELAPATALPAPVQLSFSQSQIEIGSSATLSWNVLNAFSTTMQQCYAFTFIPPPYTDGNSAPGAGTWTGKQTGTLSGNLYSGSASITPTAIGTYNYSLTCGGVETAITALTVVGRPSAMTFVASSNPAYVGQPVSLTATVTGSDATPSGTVFFTLGNLGVGNATLNSSGVGTTPAAQTQGAPPATYTVIGHYGGDANFAASSSTTQVKFIKAATTVAITAYPTSVTPPAKVLLTATVARSAAGSQGDPAGSVTFYADGIYPLATVQLNLNDIATLDATSAGITAGTYNITAKYNGDKLDATSASTPINVTVK
jgi:uncharacterized repeat protein (TIGR03803 family)